VQSNYIRGGRNHSGCGVVIDQAASDVQILSNTLLHTGQCGIGVGSGTNHVVDGNRIYNHGLDLPNAGNTALYVWNQYPGACGPVRITNNVAVLIRPNGQLSSYWNGGGCDPLTVSGNVFDQAAITILSPVGTTMVPPPIPAFPLVLMNPQSNVLQLGPGYFVAR
jgi:hypothetical protein